MVDSNRIVDLNKLKKDSEIKLEMFLKSFNLGETIQNHLQYEEIKNRFMSVFNDVNGWSKIKGSKKYNILGQTKKYEVEKKMAGKNDVVKVVSNSSVESRHCHKNSICQSEKCAFRPIVCT